MTTRHIARMKRVCRSFGFIVLYCALSPVSRGGDGYYLRIGHNYPEHDSNSWQCSACETQGVAHDDDYWYFTVTGYTAMPEMRPTGFMWRLPDYVDLENPDLSDPHVASISMVDLPTSAGQQFARDGYWHWGDLDHYRFVSLTGVTTDFLVVPARGENGVAIAVFRAPEMAFLGFTTLLASTEGHAVIDDMGWCAVRATDGLLFTSRNDADTLYRYTVNWSQLGESGNAPVILGYAGWAVLDCLGGGGPIHDVQGGEFTPAGDMLYLSSGTVECPIVGRCCSYPDNGLHAFRVIGRDLFSEVQRSTNADRGEIGYFNYSFENDCTGESPEGLTVWDRDDGPTPYVWGQLHVLVFDYNVVDANTVTMQSFTNRLYVDGINGAAATGNPADAVCGSEEVPFKTIGEALEWYPAWDGAEVVLRPGGYEGPMTLRSSGGRVRVRSWGGAARLGGGAVGFGVELFSRRNYGGDSRLLIGNTPDLDLGTIDFADVAMSVKVYNAHGVRLYDGRFYSGRYLEVSTDLPDLSGLGWGVGSVRIGP